MIRAILAGGLVLGVGAAVTLAAWNDSEFATGTFTAGTFDLEGSTDGTTFAQHASSGAAATLVFTVAGANLALSPTDKVATPFVVRLATGTTNNGNVVIQTPTSTGTVSNLTYEVVRVATAGACTTSAVDSTGTSLITAGTAITSVAGPNTFGLTKGATLLVPGTAQVLCFKFTAGAIAQGQTGTVTWQLQATSL
ncbi:MAG TPA: SipW-dependent-type signal peptide-containing protein [Pseudolysinimonas sp.]|jgi:predicted ribosomally synthesized peptide with SipW-like signal peptide|nr:SipW-dependent-type signal peptide-containing protein [Pseudolysinimonas sp.]